MPSTIPLSGTQQAELSEDLKKLSEPTPTQNVYIKTVSADAVAAMPQLESAVPFSTCSQPQATKLMK